MAAEVLGTIGGFGSSLFFVPIAGLFFDFHTVLGITALFHLASNISKIAMFRRGVDSRLVLRMGIPSVICVIAGSWLSRYANGDVLEVVLGFFLVLLSLSLLVFKRLVIQPTPVNAVTGGILSGFIAGLLGTGGAIRGLVLAAFNLPKEIFIATSAVIDLGIDLSRSVVYVGSGYVHSRLLYLVPVLLAVSIAGTYVGKKILMRFSQVQFKYTVLWLILLVGLVLLAKMVWPQVFDFATQQS